MYNCVNLLQSMCNGCTFLLLIFVAWSEQYIVKFELQIK